MKFIAIATSPDFKECRAWTLAGLKEMTAMWPHYNWTYYELREVTP